MYLYLNMIILKIQKNLLLILNFFTYLKYLINVLNYNNIEIIYI